MKERLDVLLVNKGFFDNVEKAKRAIMAGTVMVNDMKIDKIGTQVKEESEIRIKGEELRYVSRGGLKLEKAMKEFNLDFEDAVVMDIGASTGGFTDCALQHGAKFVYSIDVGTNQLDWKLRQDKRVKSLEKTHIKDLTLEKIDNMKMDYIVIDVSFISLTSFLGILHNFSKQETNIIALIKPQFEVEKEYISKGGIVENFEGHKNAIEKVTEFAKRNKLCIKALTVSPIMGTKGNVEYLALINGTYENNFINIDDVIDMGKNLKGGNIAK